MPELTIPRSELAIGKFDPDENGAMCPVAHILHATDCVWDDDGMSRFVFSRFCSPPDEARSLFDEIAGGNLELGADAWSAIGAFDDGDIQICLRLLADLGWKITILEDEPKCLT